MLLREIKHIEPMTNQDVSANNKRIAKNTLFLYIRMIAATLLSLVTVKYTLQILGINDYGIYNVVGGVVSFLTFVNATMSSATQRFLSYELGRNDIVAYNETFNSLLLVFVCVGVLMFVILEALTSPLIYSWLQIPDARRGAAEMVYHLSVVSFVFSFIAIPFISSILANERMGVYAYITIADTAAKLLLLAILVFSPYDKLLSYSVGILLISLVINLIYVIYNQRFINATRIRFFFDKKLFVRLLNYIGWSFLGSISGVMCNQGLSILMNLFFGVAVNAAKAIADRVMNIIQSFVLNFYMAVSPQITKTYAAGDIDYTIKLAFNSTRLAFYLMMILSVPLMILADDILKLWLGETCTNEMVVFTQLSLIFALVNVFETPITFMIRATGDIKRYQIYVGMFTLLVVPISYLLYLYGCPAYSAFVCEILIYLFVQIIRIRITKLYYPISVSLYFKEVLAVPLLISVVVYICDLLMQFMGTDNLTTAFWVFVVLLVLVWFIGLRHGERKFIAGKVLFVFTKRRNRL